MMRMHFGETGRYCDGQSRRHFLQVGLAGMGAATLGDIWRTQQAHASSSAAQKKSVILLWLDGGPSHMDLYDMKPEAPDIYRGLWKPIPTNVSGIDITELFPKQAKVADKFSLVRSLHHDSGDHFTGGHYMLTSRGAGVSGANTTGKYPSIGSIVAKLKGANRVGMPGYISVPYASSIGLRPGYFGANYLGSAANPFETNGDPANPKFQVQNVHWANGLTLERLQDRRTLLTSFDSMKRDLDKSGALAAMDRFDQEAYELVHGPAAREAFDLNQEDEAIRDLYGRHTWGQSTLLARRLVEAGSTFVTVHFGGWDHHWDLEAGMNRYLPKVDDCVAGLFTDLAQRGLLESTLVVLCGEFSRTPKMNDGGNGGPPRSKGTPGRDHWGNAMFCLMGGGGVKGGQIVGSTDRLGERPASRPVTPANIHATIYKVLGIDPATTLRDHAGRPVHVLDDTAAIDELF